jgi:hypothetical protein
MYTPIILALIYFAAFGLCTLAFHAILSRE